MTTCAECDVVLDANRDDGDGYCLPCHREALRVIGVADAILTEEQARSLSGERIDAISGMGMEP